MCFWPSASFQKDETIMTLRNLQVIHAEKNQHAEQFTTRHAGSNHSTHCSLAMSEDVSFQTKSQKRICTVHLDIDLPCVSQHLES